MKKRLAKWLNLPTQEEIDELKGLVMMAESTLNAAMTEVSGMRVDIRMDKQAMKALYGELRSDISICNQRISKIKPILRVDDEEAVKFIKDILSKHDHKMNTQERQLTNEIQALVQLKDRVEDAEDTATKASNKINNVLNGLGLTEEMKPEDIKFHHLKDMLVEAAIKGKTA